MTVEELDLNRRFAEAVGMELTGDRNSVVLRANGLEARVELPDYCHSVDSLMPHLGVFQAVQFERTGGGFWTANLQLSRDSAAAYSRTESSLPMAIILCALHAYGTYVDK